MLGAGLVASFDLNTSSAGGQGRGIVIEETALAWECGGQRRRAFDEIAAIHLWADLHAEGPVAICDITFAGGERLRLMVTDADFDPKEGKYAGYRKFVLEFFERLGPARRARIDFQEGPGTLRRVSWIIFSACMLAACLVGLVVVGVESGGFGWEDNSWLLLPLLLLFMLLTAGMLVASLRSRDQPFDPSAVPTRALPLVPGVARRATAGTS